MNRSTRPGVIPFGIRQAFSNLLSEVKITIKHQNGVRKARTYANASDIKLQFGCGNRLKKGWVNVDLSKAADLTLDLREALPFRDNSCSIIYSEHFLEHIDYPGPVSFLLQECHRILKPDGIFSAVVPDIDVVMHAYVNGGDEAYYEAQKKWHPKDLTTQIEQVNHNFRQQGEHKFCYDFETLKLLLEKCGFSNVVRREYDQELDTKERIMGSLYVQCTKR